MFPDVSNPLPASFASQLVTYDYPTVASGYLPVDMRKTIRNREGNTGF